MNNYLNDISNIDNLQTDISLSLADGVQMPVLELSGQPQITTSSLDEERLSTQDNAQYLSPKKIKLRKYTLKKG